MSAVLAFLVLGGPALGHPAAQPQRLELSTVRPEKGSATLLFTNSGELLAVHRVFDRGNRSTRIRIDEFESADGTLKRSALLPAPERIYSKGARSPFFDPRIGAARFALSPDGDRLLYAEVERTPSGDRIGFPVMVLSVPPFRVESTTDTQRISPSCPAPWGFSPDGRVVVIGQDMSTAAPHLLQVRLDAGDLSKAVEFLRYPRPEFGELLGYAFPRSWWFRTSLPRSGPFFPDKWYGLLEYDAERGVVVWEPSAGAFVTDMIAQEDAVVAVTSEQDGERDVGRIVRFERPHVEPTKTHRQPDCKFTRVVASPDGRFGAALCRRTGKGEWGFGATVTQKLVVFDTVDLKVLTEIEFSRWTRLNSIALWHGDGQVRLAVHDDSRQIRLYRLAMEPVPGE